MNYRYKADELVYLLDNADAEAVVYQACYAMRIWEIRDRLPKVKLYIQVDDGTESLLSGSLDFESIARRGEPMPRVSRSPDSVYMLYTGGTTGMPKGVMYPAGEFIMRTTAIGAMGRGLAPPTGVAEVPDLVRAISEPPVSLPACPLMHGTGMWLGAMVAHSAGGTVVTLPKLGLDAEALWTLVDRHGVTDMVIVGDAFARPLLEALDAARNSGTPYDLSSLRNISSSGVMWSSEIKQGLLRHHDMTLTDIMGSSEGGMGNNTTTRDAAPETAKFELSEGVKVFNEQDQEVQPSSGEMGVLALSGGVPLGYYKDPEKSAKIFREVNGVRYSFPGDFALVEADGSITLLGRGSACINFAGEKVFPEEVEEAVKLHEGVVDCLVVGFPDERFGQSAVAVTSVAEQDVIDFAREHPAGYKVPKQVVITDTVQRAPNGKADYKWARRAAEAALV
ncbi:MAG: AMP-binding protein [Pseudomonadales bacterium]|nr:AMP-binding protein [Pseudomonadales bacterium]